MLARSTKLTVLSEEKVFETDATVSEAAVRLSPEALLDVFGWELKPQGLCKGTACVPIQASAGLATAEGIDLATLADVLGRPLAVDVLERVACMGESARERGTQLASLQAPDFTLPDLSGRMHSLSDYRGKRVLLVAHASW